VGFTTRLLWLRRPWPALGCAVLGAAWLLLAEPGKPALGAAGAASILFLDVGHGDAAVLRSGADTWLVDAGPRAGRYDAGRRVVLPALRAEGIGHVDVLVVSHADLDHIGGAAAVVSARRVGEVWIDQDTYASPASLDLRRVAARRHTPIRLVSAGSSARLGELQVSVLWPPRGIRQASSNASSLVLRLEGPGGCAMLGGDAPAPIERSLAPSLAPCALLKLSHHGSASSTDPAWLDALDPGVAVASTGRAGFPHPRVSARLRDARVSLYDTRRSGAVRILFTAQGLVAIPFRP
jgi:competence protein ComEC